MNRNVSHQDYCIGFARTWRLVDVAFTALPCNQSTIGEAITIVL
jgi:hypothetical protein